MRPIRDVRRGGAQTAHGPRQREQAAGMVVPDDAPNKFKPFLDYEQEAIAVRTYQSTAIPGLLQTPEYVWAMSKVLVPGLPTKPPMN